MSTSRMSNDQNSTINHAAHLSNGISIENKQKAEAIRLDANKSFQNNDYELAIKLYTQAIELDPTVPAIYANRAFAHFKMESFGLAVSDAEKAIEIDASFAKAYYRKASALMAMLKFKPALADLKILARLCPQDQDVKRKLDECVKIIRQAEFEKAIACDHEVKSAFTVMNIPHIVVEDSYDGPRLPDDGKVTEKFAKDLVSHFRAQKKLHRKYAYQILLQSKQMLEAYPTLVDVPIPQDARILIFGDTHGQFYDVCNIFDQVGYPSPTNMMLWNGDFVDRGSFSVEVIFSLLVWKLVYPDAMFLARGNHETTNMNKMYGFEGEVVAKYNAVAFNAFTEVFNALPIVHVIGGKVMCVHGGLSQKDGVTLDDIRKINRFKQPDGDDLMTDLLWADPQDQPGRGPSKRGTGLQFGPDVTKKFLEQNNLSLLIRSHEVKKDGYEIAHDGKCITVFSAPNYCDSVGNSGAYIVLKSDLQPLYRQFEAVAHPSVPPMKFSPLRML